MTGSGGERPEFAWDKLVPELVHPMKVAIVEAMTVIGEPLSANAVRQLCEEDLSVSYISYHFQTLLKVGAIEHVRTEQSRGACEKFYVVRSRMLSTDARARPAD